VISHSNIYHSYPAVMTRQPCGFVPRPWVGCTGSWDPSRRISNL